jgi:hypothetical protein
MTGERARIARCYYARPPLRGRICPNNGSSARCKKAPMEREEEFGGLCERHGLEGLSLFSNEAMIYLR